MRSFIFGVILGASIALPVTVFAGGVWAGGAGFMMGYDVVIDGETVCHDPYIWPATREIECD